MTQSSDRDRFIALVVIFALIAMAVPSAATLTISQGHFNLRTVMLTDTEDDIWNQYGRSERQAILDNLEAFWNLANDRQLSREALIEQALEAQDFMPADFLEDVKTLSEGANIEYPEILAFNLLSDKVNPNDECTVFVAAGSGSVYGETMISKNRDLNGSYVQVLVLVSPSKGHSYMGVGSAGLVGIAMGMNDVGVSIADTSIPVPEYDPAGYSTYTVMKHVLEEADDVEAAISLIDSMPKTTGAMYAVGDRNSTALVETVPTIYSPDVAYEVIRNGVSYHTNHYIFEPFQSWVMNGSFAKVSPASYARYDRAAELVSATSGVVSQSDLMTFLRDLKGFGVSQRRSVIDAHPEVPQDLWNSTSSGYSIANNMTSSSGIFVSDKQEPGLLSTMWMAVANPHFSPFVPIHDSVLSDRETSSRMLSPYLEGTAWNYSNLLRQIGNNTFDRYDNELQKFEQRALVETTAAELNASHIFDESGLLQAACYLSNEDYNTSLAGLAVVQTLLGDAYFDSISEIPENLTLMIPIYLVMICILFIRMRPRGRT